MGDRHSSTHFCLSKHPVSLSSTPVRATEVSNSSHDDTIPFFTLAQPGAVTTHQHRPAFLLHFHHYLSKVTISFLFLRFRVHGKTDEGQQPGCSAQIATDPSTVRLATDYQGHSATQPRPVTMSTRHPPPTREETPSTQHTTGPAISVLAHDSRSSSMHSTTIQRPVVPPTRPSSHYQFSPPT